ncbi:hypothetical protein SEA_BIG4_61 [Microbacterium phage Big4]|nr:hypothetical protein SEA_BIG4_61 [Microbacterium phage Big4]
MPIGPRYDHLYVGDVPPVPTMPFPPAYPPGFGVPQPNLPVWNPGDAKPPAQEDTELMKFLLAQEPKPAEEATTMTVWMIWVTDADPNSEIWLLDAWDEDSIQANREGWTEKVENAFDTYGGAYVRVAKTTVDFDKVRAAFEPVEV